MSVIASIIGSEWSGKPDKGRQSIEWRRKIFYNTFFAPSHWREFRECESLAILLLHCFSAINCLLYCVHTAIPCHGWVWCIPWSIGKKDCAQYLDHNSQGNGTSPVYFYNAPRFVVTKDWSKIENLSNASSSTECLCGWPSTADSWFWQSLDQ